jgi:hypothetical protein
MLHPNFVIIGTIISAIGTISYIIETVKGTVKPNRVSFLLWSVARMMAQYVLLEKGYSPMLIARNQRQDYLEALDAYVRFGKADQYTRFMVRACERGAEAALSLVEESGTSMRVPKLLKIGDLAAASKESIVTIRHWAKEGILTVSEHTPGGYMLFSDTMIERVREVRRLQKKGMSLSEIKTQ